MTNELTAWCNYYYQLTMLHSEQEEYLKDLLDNAPLYCGQTRLSEIDAILSYYDDAQAYKAKMDKTHGKLMATERTIRMIMRHVEIPPGTVLTGEMPGEMAYEVWADEYGMIYIEKTEDIAPAEDDPNVIVIKFSGF